MRQISKGLSFSGTLSYELRKLLKENKLGGPPVSVDPGEYICTVEGSELSVSVPVGLDVWYLYREPCLLPDSDEDSKTYVDERLENYFSKLSGLKCLRSLRKRTDLYEGYDWSSAEQYFLNTAPYSVKELRFETALKNKSYKYPSDKEPKDTSVFLAIPVGQLGVMEVLSLLRETEMEEDSFAVPSDEAPVTGGGMFPPKTVNFNKCLGTHIYERSYLTVAGNTVYPASEFSGCTPVKPHYWLRVYILSTDTCPVPGEFIGVLAKPTPIPHVWWFQESSPFLYAGNWFETQYWTSGVVKAIHDLDDVSYKCYEVLVKGITLYLKPTDFKQYEVGDRVAIVKTDGTDTFSWQDLKDREGESSESSPLSDWFIIPYSFYEDEAEE